MSDTILSLCWCNREFSAVAVQRGKVTATWRRPGEVGARDDFAALVKDAIDQTGYTGVQASLVLAHPRLTQQLDETPDIKGPKLSMFLDRRARKLKTFEGEPAWSHQLVSRTKNAQAVLLQIMPIALRRELVEGCAKWGLRLTRLFPATRILQEQLRGLTAPEGGLAMVAAETGETTAVVVGRPDSVVHLGRSVNNSWNRFPDRLMIDLNRTMLYVKQQFGAAVSQIWLWGPGAAPHMDALQRALKVPVAPSPVAPDPFYWNHEAIKLPEDDPNNLISIQELRAPQRRALVTVTAVVVAVFAVIAVASAFAIHMMVTDRSGQVEKLEARLEKLRARKAELSRKEGRLQLETEFVRLVTGERTPPVATWFLRYLGDILPNELVLTAFQIKSVDAGWMVHLGGSAQATPKLLPATVRDHALSLFLERLKDGPFHFELMERDAAPPPGFADKSAAPSTVLRADGEESQFLIRGIIK